MHARKMDQIALMSLREWNRRFGKADRLNHHEVASPVGRDRQ